VTQFVYLGGEVKLPGEKRYRRGLTLTQAINAAGGVTSNGKEARIGRDDGKGFLVVTRFKLKEIESGKIPDPVVKPGDRITVRD
jgi:protein involved in polysaccharide export with SLBB domain